MKQSEYFRQMRLRTAVLRKNQVDTAFEIYTTLTEEEHCTMNLCTFCGIIGPRLCVGPNLAYTIVKMMQTEYQVEFAKTRRGKSPGHTGHKHSEETKKKISIQASTRQLGKKRGPYRATVERNLKDAKFMDIHIKGKAH